MNALLLYKILRDLGPEQTGLYALYKLSLRLGLFRNAPRPQTTERCLLITDHFLPPSRESILAALGSEGKRALLREANEIAAGRVRLFGGDPVELNLASSAPLRHWADYETGRAAVDGDIKFIWEPARFGWATVLARAYYVSGREKFAESFWNHFETFASANPAYQGPNWISAQEAALRVIAWTFCLPLLRESESTTEPRLRAMGEAIALHAERIPPTLIYARSQNNNHLLSEAAGLITAASVLPNHPHAKRWKSLGEKWFNRGLEKQIDSYGEYSQHSANYHRLMLQLALWVGQIGNLTYGPLARKNLSRASHWLASMLDSESGGVPNLGANDGAYILPLTVCPFADYRPVVQASARAFLNYDLPGGVWDEMSLWFGLTRRGRLFEAGHYLGDHRARVVGVPAGNILRVPPGSRGLAALRFVVARVKHHARRRDFFVQRRSALGQSIYGDSLSQHDHGGRTRPDDARREFFVRGLGERIRAFDHRAGGKYSRQGARPPQSLAQFGRGTRAHDFNLSR